MAFFAGRQIFFMVASVIAPLHPYLGEVNRSLCRRRIEGMGLVAVVALGNVFFLV
jgi:hypothetical protein